MIGFSGCSGTGKTTLAVEIAKMLGLDTVLSDIESIYNSMGYNPKGDYSFKERMLIQNAILSKAESDYKECESRFSFVSDRTPVDFLAYTMADVQRTTLSSGDTVLMTKYMERCFEVLNRYFSSVFVIQPGIEFVNSDKRPSNPIYNEHINHLVLGLLSNESVHTTKHVISRSNVSLNSRVNSIIGVVSQVCEDHFENAEDLLLH